MNTASTQICRYFANGVCNQGDYCPFQHVQPADSKFINISHTNGYGVPKSQRPCRNVATYGYCKYQNRGCEYYHGPTGNESNGEHEVSGLNHAMQSTSLDGSPKSTASSSPVPSIELTPVNEHSPQYRPGMLRALAQPQHSIDNRYEGQRQSRDPSPLHSPRHASPMQLQPVVPIPYSPSRHAPVMVSRSPPGQYHSMSPSPINGSSPVGSLNHSPYMNGLKPNGVIHYQDPNMHHHHEYPNHFFVPAQHQHPIPNAMAHPTMFIMPGPPAVLSQPVQRRPISFFISDDLKKELQRRSELMLKGTSPDDPEVAALPRMLHRYHSLYPLENIREENVSKVFGLRTLTFKASAADGRCYALKKIDGIRLHESAVQCIEAWKQLHHSNIVPVREMFASNALDNMNALFLAYDYFPGADTLDERFLRSNGEQEKTAIPKDVMWSITVQIASALRVIHAAGLSCRIFPSKVLISGKCRVRINWTGIEELLSRDLASKTNIAQAQAEDLKCFGKLLLVLCHRSLLALQNVTKALDHVEGTYGAELRNVISRLLETKPSDTNQTTINDICQSISGRILEHLDRVQNTCDDLESDLMKELENGRMFRLLVKLGFINERPEFDQHSANWSETEDRYVLKLFRDFVFHQVYEDGTPAINFQHVIDALNKLDAGVDEKILLTSRDQKTTLYISYNDLRRMAAHSFDELLSKMAQSNDEYARHYQFRNQPQMVNGRPQLIN